MPRVRRLLKNLGSKSLTVMFYTPVILYVYSYVLLDCIYSRPDSNVT